MVLLPCLLTGAVPSVQGKRVEIFPRMCYTYFYTIEVSVGSCPPCISAGQKKGAFSMKYRRMMACLFAALTLAALSGCQTGTGDSSAPVSEESASVSDPVSEPSASSESAEQQGLPELTAEEKLEEFDFLCGFLDEAYPYWPDVEAIGVDKEAVYDEYRQRVEQPEDTLSYFNELYAFFRALGGFGHLGAVDGNSYQIYLSTYRMLKESGSLSGYHQMTLDTLEQPAVAETYALLDPSGSGFRLKDTSAETPESSGEPAASSAGTPSQLSWNVWTNGIAYLKIPSFMTEYYETDGEEVAELLERFRDSENLILDIRGNGGGNSLYWLDYLVRPNAKTDLTSEAYYLYRMNDYTLDYAEAVSSQLMDISQCPLPVDTGFFTHYVLDRMEIPAAEDPYQGKIWLLVDGGVASAAEEFAMFCQSSGFATLVGSRTYGDNPYGTPPVYALPDSGFLFRMGTFYGLNPDGSSNQLNGTTPDILVPAKEDALDYCISVIKGEVSVAD